MVAKMEPKWILPNEGLSSKVYPTPPLGLSPSLLSLKGTLTDLQGPPDAFRNIYICISIMSAKADREVGEGGEELSWRVLLLSFRTH